MLATAPGVYKLFMEGGDNVPYVGPTQKKLKMKVQRKLPTYFNLLVLNVFRRGVALPPVELVELVLVVLQLAETLHFLRSLLAGV